jgi:hypothetical protein
MTGFTTNVFLSRNRVSPKEAFEGLELCERKLSCTVLRGLDGSNPVRLLGNSGVDAFVAALLSHDKKIFRPLAQFMVSLWPEE